MGGVHKRGSRKGQWKKTIEKAIAASQDLEKTRLQQELYVKSTELQAALQIAADLTVKLQVAKKHALGWNLRCTRLRLTRARLTQSAQTSNASTSSSASTSTTGGCSDEVVKRLVDQLNSIKEENVALNRARFRCRRCG
jgi:hypothetical protein